MSSSTITKKVNVLGTWHEDVFTDALVKKIAACALTEKGKKARVKLSNAGVKITRPRFLQSDKSQFYPSDLVKTVASNPGAPACVMFILADPDRRYQVVAVRCAKEEDAGQLVAFMAQQKKDLHVGNVELRKRDNGNWTLRERSAHNANRHMAELFSQQGNRGQQLTHVTTLAPAAPVIATQNGDAPNHTQTVLEEPANTPRGSYVKRGQDDSFKRNGAGSAKKYVVPYQYQDKDGEDYVIETEVDAGDNDPYDVKVLRSRVNSLSEELHEIKTALDHTDTPPNDVYRGYSYKTGNPSYKTGNPHHGYTAAYPHTRTTTTTTYPEHESRRVYTGTRQHQPVIYRSEPKTYEARVRTTPAGFYANPLAAYHRRLSVPAKRRDTTDSLDGSVRVKFDSQSVVSISSRKSKSLRERRVGTWVPTTVMRSIENTYARPVLVRRHGTFTHAAFVDRPRPMSFHVIEPAGYGYHDVAL